MRSSAEPADIQPTGAESRRGSRSGKPKLFQCTGYGDCRMVFTRSEHLARHMRKHTGEKPFKCIVPGCERMFSRFDNMMQHTQTHNKSRSSRRSKGNTKKKSSTIGTGGDPDQQQHQQPHYPGMPSPPPSRRSSVQSNLARHRYSDDEDEDEDDYNEADADSDASYHPPTDRKRHTAKEQRAMMAQLRRLSQEEAAMNYHHPSSQYHYHYQQHQPFYYPTYNSVWPPPPPQPGMIATAPPPLMMNHSIHPHAQPTSFSFSAGGTANPTTATVTTNNHVLIPSHPETPPSPTESADMTDYSSTTSSSYHYSNDKRRNSSNRYRITPQVHFHPYPHQKYYNHSDEEEDEGEDEDIDMIHSEFTQQHRQYQRDRRGSQDFLAGQMILPRLASYLVKNPGESPESYLLHHQGTSKKSPPSTTATTTTTGSPPPSSSSSKTRRLSVQDLCNPIESLEPTATRDQESGVDLTEDEFQALQGFGRFRLVAIASSDSTTTTATPSKVITE